MTEPVQTSHGWELLSREFGEQPFFSHGIGRPERSKEGMTLSTPAHFRHFCFRLAVLCLLGGAAVLAAALYIGGMGVDFAFPLVLALLTVLPFGLVHVWMGLLVERAEFSEDLDEVRFVWGRPGRTQCVRLPCATLWAVLDVGERGEAEAGRAGIEELRLRSKSKEGRICLARARKPNALREAYDSLAAFGATDTADRTHEDVPLPDGSTIRVSREATCRTPLIPYELDVVCPTRAVGSGRKSDYVGMYVVTFVLLVLLSTAGVFGGIWWPAIMVALLSLVLLFAMPPWRLKRFVLDRDVGAMLFRRWFGPWQRRRFEDLAALQICAYYKAVQHGCWCYETNVVEAGPRASRLTLGRTTSSDKVWREAGRLAQFMGLPLIDHAGVGRAHERVPLEGDGTAHVNRLSMWSEPHDNGTGIRPRVRFVSDDVARGAEDANVAILGVLGFFLGFVALMVGGSIALTDKSLTWSDWVAFVPGTCLLLLGIVLMCRGSRWLTLDRAAGLLRTPHGLRRWEERPLSDIAAVQLCQSKARGAKQPLYEINLIMRGEGRERTPFLHTAAAPEGVLWDAQRVARMLGVPLLNHTREEHMWVRRDLSGGVPLSFSRHQVGMDGFVADAGPLRCRPGEIRVSGRHASPNHLLGAGALLAVGLLLSALVATSQEHEPWAPLLLIPVATALLAMIAGWLIKALRRPAVDRSTSTLRLPTRMFGTEQIPMDNIAAVQLCSAKTMWFHRHYVEVDLVLREEPVRRVLFHTRRAVEDARTDGEELAKFLDVPLLDHTDDAIRSSI